MSKLIGTFGSNLKTSSNSGIFVELNPFVTFFRFNFTDDSSLGSSLKNMSGSRSSDKFGSSLIK
jgi:hypothetical protein